MSEVRFTEDQSTNLATLYGRALDARAEHPVLADPVFDDVVRDFIAANDECTVVHLGAGMDSRVFRIDPPATVRWFDVGFAELAERTSDSVRTSSTYAGRSTRSGPTRPCSARR